MIWTAAIEGSCEIADSDKDYESEQYDRYGAVVKQDSLEPVKPRLLRCGFHRAPPAVRSRLTG